VKHKKLMAAVSGLAAALVSTLATVPATSAEASTPVWTGYIDVAHEVTFNQVTADFRIPGVLGCTSGNSKASFWIGLWGGGTIEQVGISTNCISSEPKVQAWYEMYPAGVQYKFTAEPNDSVAMSVSYNVSTKKYTMGLKDLTRPSDSTKFNVTLPCASGTTCDNNQAGAILEAAGGTNLSLFGTTGFTEFDAITNTGIRTGLAPNGAVWGLAKTLMVGQNGQPLANLSAITDNGEVFSLTYKQPR
jgi:hypothetical protein